jgi:GNAT superfamily N-acetyltransferase
MWRYLARHTPGALFESVAGAALVSFSFPHRLFNSVLFASVPDVAEAVQRASDVYRKLERPWCWIVGPRSQPAALNEQLLAAGFTHSHDTPCMAAELSGATFPPNPRVSDVTDSESFEIWLDVVARGFGMPAAAVEPFRDLHKAVGWQNVPVRYFYASLDGEPAACSMNFYGGGVCGIYCVATVPESRRQGLGEAVVNRCLAAAAVDGYTSAVLQSSSMGLPLYEKLGFRKVCHLSYFNPPD